jgi:hypothetical protein
MHAHRNQLRCQARDVSSPSTPPIPAAITGIATSLDPILRPLGFAPGHVGCSDFSGQVIFCRGLVDSVDGECVDLVIDVESSSATWRITDVRYWGFPGGRWHLDFPKDATLAEQLGHLTRTLPGVLSSAPTGER